MAKTVIQSSVLLNGTGLEVAPNATIDVFNAGTTIRRSLWTDAAGTNPQTNPFNANAQGFFRVYADFGMVDIVATSGGQSITLEDVFLADDRLAAGVTDSQTDTTPGRITKVGDYGWGGIAIRPPNNDLNDALESAIWFSTTNTLNTPPGYQFGVVLTQKRLDNEAGVQVFFNRDSPGMAVRTRAAAGGSTFGNWGIVPFLENNQTFTANQTIDANLNVTGSVSKGSGSFKITHPVPEMSETHHLVHSFIEGPQADLMYRGSVQMTAGTATVDIDTAAGMTSGTFELLCRDVQVWVQNEDGWDKVRGSVTGSTLTIESENTSSTDTVSWLVIGERQDEHMKAADWTDEDGRVIVEPLIPEPEPDPEMDDTE